MANHVDTVIIGAGISGINTAYHIQTSCPKLSWTILEGRHELGGTWSLFKYPGVRSDSDLYTFGFSWEPWQSPNPIAEGQSITDYLNSTAKKHGIDKHIKYNHFVKKLNWSTKDQLWTLDVTNNGKPEQYTCKYVVLGTGYYDYKEPLKATIPGLENFKGQVIHPQFWPQDLDYTNKKIIIIGSGATAVTLLPALTKKAAKVTQVQRSPGYFITVPETDPLDAFITRYTPKSFLSAFIRYKYILVSIGVWLWCKTFPQNARKALRAGVKAQLPDNFDMDPHFKPAYDPWDQRVCIIPQGDYFKAYKTGRADIKTGHIETVTSDGLVMKNTGEKIDADIIVTATGLKVAVGGGAQVFIDGEQIDVPSKFMWKNAMVSDIPNLWYVIGYINSSWTLAADTTARLITRMINNMESKGQHSATPKLTRDQERKMDSENVSLLNLKSTYVNSAAEKRSIPRAGSAGNWKRRSNYVVDMWRNIWGNVTDGMQYA